jgi:hypothetical protein
MTAREIARRRLRNQRLIEPIRGGAGAVVGWLGAVQAQDYAGSRWALGSRLLNVTDHDIERAFDEGAILRTHVLRPTWHFVTPADIRWMLELTAPRVHVANGHMYRKLGLDRRAIDRSNAALARALRGDRYRTREELRGVLQKAGVAIDREFRMAYLMMWAELDGIVCSGPRRGKQFTYALVDERAPEARTLTREEALAELARRYFASRGPATVHDFAKWSGLTLADARSGLEATRGGLRHAVVDGRTLWYPPGRGPKANAPTTAHLLSIYDEYVSGYKDRGAMIDGRHAARLSGIGQAFTYIVVVDGRIVGAWKRRLRKTEVDIQADVFARLTRPQKEAVAAAVDRYGAFLGRSVTLGLK